MRLNAFFCHKYVIKGYQSLCHHLLPKSPETTRCGVSAF
jgi:hypothetical protein